MNDAAEMAADMLVQRATLVVSSYVKNNALSAAELPLLIAAVHGTLKTLSQDAVQAAAPPALVPPVPIKHSVTADYIICLEDGKRFKALKRHLWTAFQMTPEQYRRKWNLPATYPMVAPNFAALRADLAKANGLGRKAAPAVSERRKVA